MKRLVFGLFALAIMGLASAPGAKAQVSVGVGVGPFGPSVGFGAGYYGDPWGYGAWPQGVYRYGWSGPVLGVGWGWPSFRYSYYPRYYDRDVYYSSWGPRRYWGRRAFYRRGWSRPRWRGRRVRVHRHYRRGRVLRARHGVRRVRRYRR